MTSRELPGGNLGCSCRPVYPAPSPAQPRASGSASPRSRWAREPERERLDPELVLRCEGLSNSDEDRSDLTAPQGKKLLRVERGVDGSGSAAPGSSGGASLPTAFGEAIVSEAERVGRAARHPKRREAERLPDRLGERFGSSSLVSRPPLLLRVRQVPQEMERRSELDRLASGNGSSEVAVGASERTRSASKEFEGSRTVGSFTMSEGPDVLRIVVPTMVRT